MHHFGHKDAKKSHSAYLQLLYLQYQPVENMTDKFRNRYRITTSRAPWWDYGNGSNFVTICTRNRLHFFGEIIDAVMQKSQAGEIAETHWKEIPGRFVHARLGAYIFMPNHMHGIINIEGSHHESLDLETNPIDFRDVEYLENNWKPSRGGITGIHNPMLNQNLSTMLRWYTGRVSYEAHKINPDFGWHKRFHDRIIRDPKEYKIKERYIRNNPSNWKEDEYY